MTWGLWLLCGLCRPLRHILVFSFGHFCFACPWHVDLFLMCCRSVEHCFHMCDRVVIYFFIAASYTPWWVSAWRRYTVTGACVANEAVICTFFFSRLISGWTCVNWALWQHTCAGLCGSWLLLEPYMCSTIMKSESMAPLDQQVCVRCVRCVRGFAAHSCCEHVCLLPQVQTYWAGLLSDHGIFPRISCDVNGKANFFNPFTLCVSKSSLYLITFRGSCFFFVKLLNSDLWMIQAEKRLLTQGMNQCCVDT